MANGGTFHWGSVLLGGLLVLVGVLVLVTLGWRWLWIVPALFVLLWLFMFVVTVFEDRWRVVTPDQQRAGVPGTCSACGEEVLAIVGKARFKTSCPMCGHRESGLVGG